MKRNRKIYTLLLLVLTFSCEYQNIKPNNTTNNKNILSSNNPVNVDIKILNPTDKSLANWYKKDDKTIVMKLGSQAELVGTALLKDGTKSSNVTWSSSDNTVATVNNGKITPNKIGTTTILAVSSVDSTYKGILNIEVLDEANFAYVDTETINKVSKIESYISTSLGKQNNIMMKKDTNVSGISVVTLSDGTKNSNVIWESSDENIATVDKDGKIVANKLGVTTIVSKYKLNPNFKALITIEVSEIIENNNITENKNIAVLPYIEPTQIPIIIPSSSPTSTPSVTAIVTPSATQSTAQNNPTGTTTDTKERVTFKGKVYDPNQNPVDGATVTAKSVDAGVYWIGQVTQTSGGEYIFINAPVGARIEVSVTKDGWTTRTRSEILKSNLNSDPNVNVFDFGFNSSTGSTDPNSLYAIQDEPEVTSLKINGILATDSALGIANRTASSGSPDIGYSPATTGVSTDNLTIEMTFSEAVNKDDIQNYFRVLSTVGTNFASTGSFYGALTNQTQITIDRAYPTLTFAWSDDGKSLTIKTNKGILSNVDGVANEARYLIDFISQFRDLAGIKSDPKRTFRFSASKLGGFHLFSAKNQDQVPYITDFYAVNGSSGSDYLKIKFSRPMDVVGRTALAAVLSDPAVSSPVIANNMRSLGGLVANGASQSTTLGYNDANATFVPVYQVAIVKPAATTTSKGLNINDGQGAVAADLVKSAVVDSNNANTVIIELPQNAFNAGDKVVISAGGQLEGLYSGSVVNNLGSLNLKTGILLPTSNTFADLTDPAGKVLDRGNSTTSASFAVSNSQKVATAG